MFCFVDSVVNEVSHTFNPRACTRGNRCSGRRGPGDFLYATLFMQLDSNIAFDG